MNDIYKVETALEVIKEMKERLDKFYESQMKDSGSMLMGMVEKAEYEENVANNWHYTTKPYSEVIDALEERVSRLEDHDCHASEEDGCVCQESK